MLKIIECINCKETFHALYRKTNCYKCLHCRFEFFYQELGFYHMNEDNVPDYVFSNETYISF